MFIYKVAVGFSTVRPIIPDQHISLVVLLAEDDHQAHLTALLMVASRPGVEMTTRSTILEVEL